MRRKILTILLALALCVCMATSVSAAAGCRQYPDTQSVYGQLLQYLTCRLFGYGCSPGLTVPSIPQAPAEQTTSPTGLFDSEQDHTSEPESSVCTQEPCAPAPAAPVPETQDPAQKPEKPADSAVSSMEQQVVTLVNKERAAYGLPALTPDGTLSGYAQIKSQDLHDNRYFDHQSPTYGSPFDMMRSFGITYSYAGENIAMGYYSAEDVVAAWMNSSGHRANILSANYDRIGVGYVADGGYWTQWFLG